MVNTGNRNPIVKYKKDIEFSMNRIKLAPLKKKKQKKTDNEMKDK